MRVVFTYIILILCFLVNAQESERYLLWGGQAHIGNGKVIPNSAIGIEDGHISFVADASIIRIDTSSFKVIYLEGKEIYPALIALNTQIGLKEIDQVRQSHDFQETGLLNPNIRTLSSFNGESQIIPTLIACGILYVQSCPKGGLLSGKSAFFKLNEWNWEEAAVIQEDGLHINWPRQHHYHYWHWSVERGRKNKNYQKNVDAITSFFHESKAYNASKPSLETNLKYAALNPIINGKQKVFIHAYSSSEILNALSFIKDFNLNAVLVCGPEVALIKPQIKEAEIPIILDRVLRLPNNRDAAINQVYSLPFELKKEGILFAVAAQETWNQRNLAFHAGSAVAYGLSKEEALESITLSPAKILGLEDQLGSLEEGKVASLIISNGDILDPMSNDIFLGMIEGKFISLNNFQEELGRKYLKKFGIE